MFTLERFKNPRVVAVAWLVARLWLGWQFLESGWTKTFGAERAAWVGDYAGVAVGGFLGHALDVAPGGALAGPHPEVSGWYAALIRQFLLPNAETFGYLVAVGEVLVGLALILGVATRFAAAMGLMMNVAYLLGGANGVGPLMVLVELPILLVGASAGYYGLDRFLARRPRTLLAGWTWRPASSPAPLADGIRRENVVGSPIVSATSSMRR